MARQDHSRGKRYGQPFVRIDSDGVREFNPSHQATMFVGKHNRRAVSSVDVHPEMISATHFRDRHQVIHDP
jgi:hypothetical protein